MKSAFRITEAEMVSAMQLHQLGKKRTRIILVLVGIALCSAGFFLEPSIQYWGAALGGLIGYFSVYWLITPYRVKKQFRENKLLKNDVEIEIEEDKLKLSNKNGHSAIKWTDFLKWKSGKGMYLLYITSNMFHMIPAHAIEDIEAFNELLDKTIGPKDI